jgi:hypothetical protein
MKLFTVSIKHLLISSAILAVTVGNAQGATMNSPDNTQQGSPPVYASPQQGDQFQGGNPPRGGPQAGSPMNQGSQQQGNGTKAGPPGMGGGYQEGPGLGGQQGGQMGPPPPPPQGQPPIPPPQGNLPGSTNGGMNSQQNGTPQPGQPFGNQPGGMSQQPAVPGKPPGSNQNATMPPGGSTAVIQ